MKKILFLICTLISNNITFSANDSKSPEKAVSEYYSWYIKCSDTEREKDCFYYKPSSDYLSKTLTSKLTKVKFFEINYFLKVQDFDSSIALNTLKVVKSEKINGDTSNIYLSMKLFDEGSLFKYKVGTKLEDGKWKINSVQQIK